VLNKQQLTVEYELADKWWSTVKGNKLERARKTRSSIHWWSSRGFPATWRMSL